MFCLSWSRTSGIFKVHQSCLMASSKSRVADFYANLDPWGLLDWHYCISGHHNELIIDHITDGPVVLPTLFAKGL